MLCEEGAGLSLVFAIVQIFGSSIKGNLLLSEKSPYQTKRTPALKGVRSFLKNIL